MGGYLAYTEYKESGIEWLGKVPAHWQLKKLQHIARLRSGETMTAQMMNENDEFPVYGGNGLRGYFNFYTHDGNYVLIGRQGALCGNINYGSGKFWASEHAVVVSPTVELETFWLGELLRTMNLNQYSTSAAQPGISVEQIARLKIPFPPVEEQRSIARFLDYKTAQIDALITKKETLLKKLAEKRTALISQAVTKGCDRTVPMKDSGIGWLGEIPLHWESGLVKRYFSVELGKMLNRSLVVEDGFTKPYLRAANIHWRKVLLNDVNEMDFSSSQLIRYRLKKGDLLVTEGGVTVGRTAIWEGELEECYYQNSINRVRPRDSTSSAEFLYYWMYFMKNNGYIDLAANIATFGHLTQEKLQTLPFVMPPITEQKKIVNYLDAKMLNAEQQEVKINEVIEGLKEYRTALITNAVTGKIDVRDVMLELEPVEAA